MKITAKKLKDARFDNFHTEVDGRWDYEEFVDGRHPDWFRDWISFDCLLADDHRSTIWCGLTSFAGDIFYAYDRQSDCFRSLNFREVGDRYDAKFHRSLLFDADGLIWAATALLHDIDRYFDAPGGALVRFDPATEELRIVTRPIPHVYIQSIAMDNQRGIIYGMTFTPERLFRYNVADGRVTDLGPIGSGLEMAQGETIVVDRTGACWGTWGLTRAWLSRPGPDAVRLWRYHPDRGRIEFFKHGLPRVDGSRGTAKLDGAHVGPDGAIYMGTVEGLLCRVDPETAEVRPIGKPCPARRMAGLASGPDGKLYGTAGSEGTVILFRYDPAKNELTPLGRVVDAKTGECAWHIHDLAVTGDGTIYAAENDVPYRSGYLWEITDVL
ncbi:MAG: hypothetical protein GXP27_12970 [Planctomycetes bacterium]|nr:hypothetical protein [Planctomycetota bacterium]